MWNLSRKYCFKNRKVENVCDVQTAAWFSVSSRSQRVSCSFLSVFIWWTLITLLNRRRTFLQQLISAADSLFQAREPQTANSHVVTVSGLVPSSIYNCTVTSFSYSTPSKPAHITITTVGRWRCAVSWYLRYHNNGGKWSLALCHFYFCLYIILENLNVST